MEALGTPRKCPDWGRSCTSFCESGITGSLPQVLVHELTQHRKQIRRISLLLHLHRYSFFGIVEIQWDCSHDWSLAGDAQRLFRWERPVRKGGTWVHEVLSWKGWQTSQELIRKDHKTGVCYRPLDPKEKEMKHSLDRWKKSHDHTSCLVVMGILTTWNLLERHKANYKQPRKSVDVLKIISWCKWSKTLLACCFSEKEEVIEDVNV